MAPGIPRDKRGPAPSRLIAGDEAFRTWYDDTLPRVYAYLVARCGGSRDLAEELTQETFVAVVRDRHAFEGRSDPLTWVIGIARRRLADHVRREERRRRGLRRLEGHLALRGDAADAALAWASTRSDVESALAALTGEQRLAFVLRTVDRCSVPEIAELIGRSQDATESLVRRARAAFERNLAGDRDG